MNKLCLAMHNTMMLNRSSIAGGCQGNVVRMLTVVVNEGISREADM